MKKIYNYHPITKEFTGESLADESPLEPGIFLIPGSSTTIEPPEKFDGKMRIFMNGEWTYQDIPESDQPKDLSEEEKLTLIRQQRNYLLSQCDWTQLPDSPLTEEKRQEWVTYRQILRDFPSMVDINNIIWPEQP